MSLFQIFQPAGSFSSLGKNLQPKTLFSKYPLIQSDLSVHAGWPHLQGTRVLATDIYKTLISGYSPNEIILEFKELGIALDESQISQAVGFTIEWQKNLLNERKKGK